MTKNKKESLPLKERKSLGGSKYATSKKKKQVKKSTKDPKIAKKNHDLKVKIKHLQKEITRIEVSETKDAKILKNKKDLEKKLKELLKVNKELVAKAKKSQPISKPKS